MIYHLSVNLHKFGLRDLIKFRGCVSAKQFQTSLIVLHSTFTIFAMSLIMTTIFNCCRNQVQNLSSTRCRNSNETCACSH